MEGKGTSRDLMDLEHKDLSSPSLLVCTDNKKKIEEAPTRPTIGPVPKSQFHDRLKGFLGIMAESNKILEEKAKENPEAVIIEVGDNEVDDDEEDTDEDDEEEEAEEESTFIEMDLMLGVADLKTPEAVSAAEAAIAGKGMGVESGDSSSSDESDSDEDVKMGEASSAKPTKIVELS